MRCFLPLTILFDSRKLSWELEMMTGPIIANITTPLFIWQSHADRCICLFSQSYWPAEITSQSSVMVPQAFTLNQIILVLVDYGDLLALYWWCKATTDCRHFDTESRAIAIVKTPGTLRVAIRTVTFHVRSVGAAKKTRLPLLHLQNSKLRQYEVSFKRWRRSSSCRAESQCGCTSSYYLSLKHSYRSEVQ